MKPMFPNSLKKIDRLCDETGALPTHSGSGKCQVFCWLRQGANLSFTGSPVTWAGSMSLETWLCGWVGGHSPFSLFLLLTGTQSHGSAGNWSIDEERVCFYTTCFAALLSPCRKMGAVLLLPMFDPCFIGLETQ